jgi:hypothetical protein
MIYIIVTNEELIKYTTVKYSASSTYSIAIPKEIILNDNQSTSYEIKVSGNITSDMQINVEPVDAIEEEDGINFYMVETTSKKQVVATVTQDSTSCLYNKVNDANGTTLSGNIGAISLEAGEWEGSLGFKLSVSTHEHDYNDDGICNDCGDIKDDDSSSNLDSSETLNGYTWSEVQAICEEGKTNEYFSVGDTTTINIDALPNADNTTSAQTATIVVADMTNTSLTLLVTDYSALTPSHTMNTTDTNVDGWEVTSMRTWLNDEYYNALSSDLQNVITTHSSAYAKTCKATSPKYCDDKIWLLSSKEVLGGDEAESASQDTTGYETPATFNIETQLAYFADDNNSKIRYTNASNETSCFWWLRSSYYGRNSIFTDISNDGEAEGQSASSIGYVFPAFCIEAKGNIDNDITNVITVDVTNGIAIYDGNATNGGASVSVTTPSSGYTIKYGTINGTYNLTSIPTYTNVGIYTIYYQISATNYITKTGSLTITIIKASGDVVAPTIKNLTYNGEEQELVGAGSSSTGTIYYKLEDGEYSTCIPTATNIGVYTIYYKVIGDLNHNDVGESSVSVAIINKANDDMNVSVTALAAKTLTYSGEEQELVSAGSSSTGTIYYKLDDGEYSANIPTATNAGTYTVYYKVVDDLTQNDITEEASVSVTIEKPTIRDSSWSAIQAACKAGLANEYFSLGSGRIINIGALPSADNTPSAQTAVIAIGDISSDGKTITMFVYSYNTLTPEHVMNASTSNYGGWASTSMRTWLNDEYYKALPSDLQNVIKTHSTSYSASYNATSVSYCSDKIWLLSSKEVFGGSNATSSGTATYNENVYAFNAEKQLGFFAGGGTTFRSSNSITCFWWLRSSYYGSSAEFSGVNSNGYTSKNNAIYACAVFPAFCIG